MTMKQDETPDRTMPVITDCINGNYSKDDEKPILLTLENNKQENMERHNDNSHHFLFWFYLFVLIILKVLTLPPVWYIFFQDSLSYNVTYFKVNDSIFWTIVTSIYLWLWYIVLFIILIVLIVIFLSIIISRHSMKHGQK